MNFIYFNLFVFCFQGSWSAVRSWSILLKCWAVCFRYISDWGLSLLCMFGYRGFSRFNEGFGIVDIGYSGFGYANVGFSVFSNGFSIIAVGFMGFSSSSGDVSVRFDGFSSGFSGFSMI